MKRHFVDSIVYYSLITNIYLSKSKSNNHSSPLA